MGEMTEKTYKARVEIAFVVEFDIDAIHEDEAAALAEESGWDNVKEIAEELNRVRVVNYGAKCIEVEECSEPK